MADSSNPSRIGLLCAWGALGTILGLGGGYLTYVKQPPLFESASVLALSPHPEADESTRILNQTNLQKAIANINLASVPEIQKRFDGNVPSLESLTLQLMDRREVSILRLPSNSEDSIYRLNYLGPTPTTAQKLVQSLVETFQTELNSAITNDDWQEGLGLLTTSRESITQRIRDLEQSLKALPQVSGAIWEEGKIVSAESEAVKRLRVEMDQLQTSLIQVRQQISQYGSPSVVAGAAPLNSEQPNSTTTNSDAMNQQVSERSQREQIALEERSRLIREVEADLVPLKAELAKLSEKFGSGHPTVRSVQQKIDLVRSRVTQLPPLERTSLPPKPDFPKLSSPDSAPGKANEPSADEQVTERLRLLRNEELILRNKVDAMLDRLIENGRAVMAQENAFKEEARLKKEQTHQETLLQHVTTRIEQLNATPPHMRTSCKVIASPMLGVQVEPKLWPYLVGGGLSGGLSFLLLAGIVFLSTSAKPTV